MECHSWGFLTFLSGLWGGEKAKADLSELLLLSIVRQFHNYLFQESCSIDWLTSAF